MFSSLLPFALIGLPALTAQSGDEPRVVPAPQEPPAEVTPPEEESLPSEPIPGERVDPATIPDGIVESMETVIERGKTWPERPGYVHRARNGAQGTWEVPSRKGTFLAHSGEHYATNRWGDTRMGIGFGAPVNVAGAWIAGQYSEPVWTSGLVAIGYRAGEEVARSERMEGIGRVPAWFPMDLAKVDRIELVADAMLEGAGFYGMDDLTFEVLDPTSGEVAETRVLTFDDLPWRYKLTGSDYGGLDWEIGTGDFVQPEPEVVHEPKTPPGQKDEPAADQDAAPETALLGGGGTLPMITRQFNGPRFQDPGAGWLPPDTCGAVGVEHYVSVVNQHISVYDKETAARLVSTSLQNFFNTGGSAGDPRVVYDHFEGRWIVIATNFDQPSSGCFLAYSMGDDATGNWFKTFIPFSAGSDANNWCDYPTLGVDQNGIYMAAYMVGGNFLMSIFAVDKAPLLAASPSVGTVTAWRQLPWEGAIQPCVTHGTPSGEYLISRRNNTQLRVRRINPPLTSPTLTEVAFVSAPAGSSPPPAPAMGSTVPLSTVGNRLMNAVYRNGSIWAANTISAGSRPACRWYEVDALAGTTVQVGLVQDPEISFFFPAIAVNAAGDVALAFSASSPNMFAAAWYTGRKASDPLGEMAPPAEARMGLGPYNQASSGTNRWGDYSLTTVDPENDMDLWTIQEYARNNNNWGTWVTRMEFPADCTASATNFCVTAPTSTTTGALISHTGSLGLADNNTVLEVTNAPANKTGLFYYGGAEIQTPFGDGFRCVGSGGMGTYRLYPLQQTDGAGNAARALDFTAPPMNAGGGQVTAGSTWKFQFWFRDPMGPGGGGFNLSDGLSVTFCP